ncbi:hypothetical protein PMIN02_008897 [Paraphaeosphaeria minitans]
MQINSFNNPNTCSVGITVGPGTKPKEYFALRGSLSGHVYQAFAQVQVEALSKAWRVEVYADLTCTEKVGSMEGEEQETRKKLGQRAAAVEVVPL